MITDRAAKRYAEAAFLIAKEEGKQDQWLAGLRDLATLAGNPTAEAVFANSRVSLDAKRRIIEQTLKDADPNVRNLALLLLRRARTRLAPGIAEAYQELLDEARGIKHALVVSAVPLSAEEQADVQRKLVDMTGGSVTVRTEVDDSIIGGLVVRIGDRLIDGSVRSRLVALKQQLAGAR